MPRSHLHECLVAKDLPLVNTGDPAFFEKAHSKRRVYCQGFGFRDPANLEKHYESIAPLFRMNDTIRNSVNGYFEKYLANEKPLIIGFHIRRGDYIEYEDGNFFLDDEQWKHLFSDARKFAASQNRPFLGILFSNVDTSPLHACSLDLIPGPGDLYGDLEMLSRCDLIVGPPSTYSGWASFVGKVPRLAVDRSTSTLDPDGFSVVPW